MPFIQLSSNSSKICTYRVSIRETMGEKTHVVAWRSHGSKAAHFLSATFHGRFKIANAWPVDRSLQNFATYRRPIMSA